MAKPKAPTPPSPEATAKAQTGATIDAYNATNAGGMVNQRGPDGSLTYNQVGEYIDPSTGKAIPRFEAVTQLSDTAQQRYDTTNAAQQNMANIAKLLSSQIESTAGQPISYDNLPELAGSGGYEASRKSVEDALYSRLNPQMAQAREALATRLANSGVRLGSAAYDRAMQNQGMTENDARQQVVLAGGQEQSRMAGLDSAARAQLLQERTSAANEPINRLSALLSQTQVNTPQYQTYQPGTMQTTDYAGLVNANFGQQMQNYQTKVNSQNQIAGSLFGLGSAAIMGNPFGMFGAAAGVK